MNYRILLARKGDISIDALLDIIKEENGIDDDWQIEVDIDGETINWTANKDVDIDIDDDTLIDHALNSNQITHEDFNDSEIEVDQ